MPNKTTQSDTEHQKSSAMSVALSVLSSVRSSVNSVIPHLNRKSRIIIPSALFLMVCAFGAAGVAPLAPDAADLPVSKVTEQLQIPTLVEQVQVLEQRDGIFIYEEQVQRGDTLASLLQRLGVDDAAATSFIKSDQTARLIMQQKAGKTVRVQTNGYGELQWLETSMADDNDVVQFKSQSKNLTLTRQSGSDRFVTGTTKVPLERRVEMHTGEITTSLFAATDAAQIPDTVASQLVEMFSTDIDFSADLQRGDHFQIMYETFWQNGEMVGTGRILAGEFNNAGHSYQSVWFNEGKSGGGYYGFDGKSMKKAFLKSPLAFTRISSGFAMRVHPISGRWKQHSGVDFAAPTGTPIRAAADGVVETAGVMSGYGNIVVLKHWAGYSTAYAHMSRFASGVRKGSKVKQGDLIGYVGSSGWATGPHLHYEFRINNKAYDPLKVKIDQPQTLTAQEMTRFKTVVQDVRHRFALLRPANTSQIASR